MSRPDDFDELLNEADELLKYLGHLNKLDHISTVTELIRRVSSQEGTIDRQSNKLAAADRTAAMIRQKFDGEWDGSQPPRRPNVIQLPPNTRKVSIEL